MNFCIWVEANETVFFCFVFLWRGFMSIKILKNKEHYQYFGGIVVKVVRVVFTKDFFEQGIKSTQYIIEVIKTFLYVYIYIFFSKRFYKLKKPENTQNI